MFEVFEAVSRNGQLFSIFLLKFDSKYLHCSSHRPFTEGELSYTRFPSGTTMVLEGFFIKNFEIKKKGGEDTSR